MLNGDSEEDRERTRQLLCLCVDVFLRALSPFMPYLSEELYQRLPITQKAISVVVATYPEPTEVKLYTLLQYPTTHALP